MAVVPAAPAAAGEELVVPMRFRGIERAQMVQRLQHTIPAVTLLMAGVQGLQGAAEGAERALAFLEIGTSALLIGMMARAIRAKRTSHGAHPGGVDWFDLFAAAVIFTEALEKWVSHHHIARPLILMGVVTTVLGLSHGWIARRAEARRAMRFSDAGIEFGGRKFSRRFHAGWGEIAAIEVEGSDARIVLQSGATRRIDLADLHNGDEVRSALLAAQARVPKPLPEALPS